MTPKKASRSKTVKETSFCDFSENRMNAEMQQREL
jgi:hypothetical protein